MTTFGIRRIGFVLAFCALAMFAQRAKIVLSEQARLLMDQLEKLRSMTDADRAVATKTLALEIRKLGAAEKSMLAQQLAGLATEGDPGRDTMQEVATTLAESLREQPVRQERGGPAPAYVQLAELVRFEHVKASLDDPQFAAAMKKLDDDERHRQAANFTLTDLDGKSWTLNQLKGKVVLVNFWATWCPPCRKEMPDLNALYQRFQSDGLVVLAISDEDVAKVRPFIEQRKYSYPILLDPGRAANKEFIVEGIPKTFLYDRSGKLVAQAMDMRTQREFWEMLALAGLK